MVCSLPTPTWVNSFRKGLQNAVENLALQKTTLTWGEAKASPIASFNYYNIYWNTDPLDLFNTPQAFSKFRGADLPDAYTGSNPLFALRTAQLGTTLNYNSYNLSNLRDSQNIENLSTCTRNLASINWNRITTADIIQENAGISPSGFNDAFAFIASAASTEHALQQGVAVSPNPTSFAIFAKAGTQDFIALHGTQKLGYTAWFNIRNGTLGTRGPNLIDSSIEDFGNGWYKCKIVWTDTPATHTFGIHISHADNTTVFSGDGTSICTFLYGAQSADGYGQAYHLDNLSDRPAWAYPNPVVVQAAFTDGQHLQVSSIAGFPEKDGYIEVNNDILFYSDAQISFDGYGHKAFLIKNTNPFGCNSSNPIIDGYVVELFKGFEDLNATVFERVEQCFFDPPEWADKFHRGIQFAEDLGLGSVIQISWNPALTPNGLSKTYYNIYYSSESELLFATPKAITDALSVQVTGLKPGDGYYFAVRAAYFPQNIAIDEFVTPVPNYHVYPLGVTLSDIDGYYGLNDLNPIVVSPNTNGFPNKGIIKIDDELISYSSKTSNAFIVSQRDAFGLGRQEQHQNGATISFFKGIEDLNQNFEMAMPTWDGSGTGPWLPPDPSDPDGYNSMQDSDGYRVWLIDNVNEDHSEFESENTDHSNEDDLCGTYRSGTTVQIKIYTGQQCGTYIGGREDGFAGGIRLTDATLRREEFLLAQTGEPTVLLRIKTVGQQCPRFSLRGEHGVERCAICYGAHIVGGYDRYINSRLYRPVIQNPNGMIAVRFPPYKNDLPLMQYRGISQVDQISVWTSAIPTIKKRDILIRYLPVDAGEVPTEEFRYEVLDVERNRLLSGDDGKQTITVRKLDKTHEIYTYSVPVVAAAAI